MNLRNGVINLKKQLHIHNHSKKEKTFFVVLGMLILLPILMLFLKGHLNKDICIISFCILLFINLLCYLMFSKVHDKGYFIVFCTTLSFAIPSFFDVYYPYTLIIGITVYLLLSLVLFRKNIVKPLFRGILLWLLFAMVFYGYDQKNLFWMMTFVLGFTGLYYLHLVILKAKDSLYDVVLGLAIIIVPQFCPDIVKWFILWATIICYVISFISNNSNETFITLFNAALVTFILSNIIGNIRNSTHDVVEVAFNFGNVYFFIGIVINEIHYLHLNYFDPFKYVNLGHVSPRIKIKQDKYFRA